MAMGLPSDSRSARPEQGHWSQDVWAYNLLEEIEKLQELVEVYQYVTMDTVSAGCVVQPLGLFENLKDYNYQMLQVNADLTKVVQICLLLSDADGKRPEGPSSWSFNFAFDLSADMCANEAVEGLRRLDLDQHREHGIAVRDFAELLMNSGLVLNDDIKWITFGGTNELAEVRKDSKQDSKGLRRPRELPWIKFSGMYSLGYMLRLLTSQSLPDEIDGFYESLDLYFPNRCDISEHRHRLPQLSQLCGSEYMNDPQRRCGSFADHILDAFVSLPDAAKAA